MNLDSTVCYQALLTHDSRFDGAFFVGVSSTRIYCRPICPAKTPALKNCTFFANAAAAEHSGFRPCLRCRPELAPGNAKTDAVSRLAAVIAGRIEDGSLSHQSVAELAAEMKISERHLRRVIEREFGVSPIELAQTHRLLLAKQLLTDTSLPITEVAFASGFASLRRFNASFRSNYRLSPSQLRTKRTRISSDNQTITCELSYRPPLDWHSIRTFLSARANCGAETFIDDRYIRTAAFGKAQGWLSVMPCPNKHALQVEVSLSLSRHIVEILRRVKSLFDLNATPHHIADHLGQLASSHPGLRLPGAFDPFETSVRAVLGQQVSVKAATTLMKRLVDQFGETIETPFAELNRLTPSAKTVASLTINELAAIGVTSARASTLSQLAKAVVSGAVTLDQPVDPETTMRKLKELPGIGDWTAQYLAMRVLNWPDAFPSGDLGIRKALNETNERRILTLAESWRPWRSYAAMHLWKKLEV